MYNNSEFTIWVNEIVIDLLSKGFVLTDDKALWDEIQFLFEDDVTSEDAAHYILS